MTGFPGPALKCIDATQTMAKTAAAVIFGHFSAHSPAPFYYANSQSPFEDLLSFMVSPTNSSDSNQGVNDITGVGFGPGTGVLWVTTAGPDFYGGAERNQVVVRQCNLYLASYDIVIRYDNGFQSLNVVNVDYQTPFDVNNVKNLSLIPEQANSNMTYLAVMDAFTVAFGGICNSASLMQYPICEGSNTLFTSLLANANEFSSFINSSLTPNLRGLIAGRNFTLSRGLEEVFQNITLSLLGFPSFLKTLNETPKTNVTVFSPQNIFNYDPQNLWLAYGLAAGFSIIATIVGFVLLFINGESFSNCCSAIVRITRSSQIAEAMNAEDISGADPLSKHFAKTKLFMDHGTPDSSESYKSLAPAAKLDKEASESLLEKNGTH
ncbi:MAG: hypothetical protein M1821_000636 [Bathelium mastoideum]|nr:MAG: hypothetical protein M1821_000636 [Bathelium mastoideum]